MKVRASSENGNLTKDALKICQQLHIDPGEASKYYHNWGPVRTEQCHPKTTRKHTQGKGKDHRLSQGAQCQRQQISRREQGDAL